MTKLEKIYDDVKDKVSEPIKETPMIYHREMVEDGWEYRFYFTFNDNKLVKAEAWNHRELIEMYNN